MRCQNVHSVFFCFFSQVQYIFIWQFLFSNSFAVNCYKFLLCVIYPIHFKKKFLIFSFFSYLLANITSKFLNISISLKSYSLNWFFFLFLTIKPNTLSSDINATAIFKATIFTIFRINYLASDF